MEPKNTVIIEKAASIIMKVGLHELTIPNLADELKVNQSQLNKQLTKDDDILLLLLNEFESEIDDFLKLLNRSSESPETELKILFEKLYSLFMQKPYYLDIIFDKHLKERDDNVIITILRIRNMAEAYLRSIINLGKQENIFKTRDSTQNLVDKILSGFRLFMKDEQRIHRMILEMKTLKD